MTLLTRALIVLSLFALGGCASLPEAPDSSTLPGTEGALDRDAQRLDLWLTRQREVQKLKSWRCEGRAAILAQNGGGQISFDWLYNPKDQVLSIKTPLGQNALQLTVNPGGATLIDQDGQVIQGESGEALLKEALGWGVPLESLRAWLLGLPASGEDSYTLDPQGRLVTIDSQGWTIEYKRYSETQGQVSMPSKFELRRAEMSLRLVIDRWTF